MLFYFIFNNILFYCIILYCILWDYFVVILSVSFPGMGFSPVPVLYFILFLLLYLILFHFFQECLDKFGDSLQEMINYHMVRSCLLLSPWVLVALLMSPVFATNRGPVRVTKKGREFTKILNSRIFFPSFWAAEGGHTEP